MNKDAFTNKEKVRNLIEKLASKNGLERKEARKELIDLKDKEVMTMLIEILDHPKHRVRWEAMKTLEEIGDPSLITVFISKLGDDESDIRWMAAKGLIRIGKPVVEPLLNLLLENADSVFILEGSHHVLNTLYQKNNVPKKINIENLLQYLKSTTMSEKIMITAHELLSKLKR